MDGKFFCDCTVFYRKSINLAKRYFNVYILGIDTFYDKFRIGKKIQNLSFSFMSSSLMEKIFTVFDDMSIIIGNFTLWSFSICLRNGTAVLDIYIFFYSFYKPHFI